MPAAVAVPIAVAGIGAAGAITGGVIASKSANKAAKLQQQSGREALDYQRSRDARADALYDKKWAMYQQAVDEWRKRNGGATGTTPVTSSGGGSGAVPVSIADLVAGQQDVAGAYGTGAMQGQSMADAVGQWNDWNRYIGA